MKIDPELLKYCNTDNQTRTLQLVSSEGTVKKAAKKLGVSDSAVRSVILRIKDLAASRGYSPDHDMVHATPSTHILKGTSTLYGSEGEVKQQWVKTDALRERISKAMQVYASELADSVRGKYKGPKKLRSLTNADESTHLKIGDAHLGLHAWGQTTGGDNHDLKIGVQDLRGGIRELTQASAPSKSGVIVNVGDYLHSNDSKARTPLSGNQLDVDGRFAKVFESAANLLKFAVDEALTKHKEVILVNARGNHDLDAAVAMGVVQKAYFCNDDRVKVLNGESKVLTWDFGDIFHVAYHGEKSRDKQYVALTRDFRTQIGKARHIYVDNGHTHHIQRQEIGALVFEVWSPLVAKDEYHADNLYGAAQSISSVTYHKKYGEIGRNTRCLEYIRDSQKGKA